MNELGLSEHLSDEFFGELQYRCHRPKNARCRVSLGGSEPSKLTRKEHRIGDFNVVWHAGIAG